MSKKNRRQRVTKKSIERIPGSKDLRTGGLSQPRNIVFGFRYLSRDQGQNPTAWESSQLLSKLVSRLQALCSMTVEQAKRKELIKQYSSSIPSGSSFTHPAQLPETIRWASIRVQARVRVIGYIQDDYLFEVVFLDKDHLFYPSAKKRT